MNWRSTFYIAVGVIGGFCLAMLFRSEGSVKVPAGGAGALIPAETDSNLRRENDELRGQVTTIQGELSAVRTQTGPDPKIGFKSPEQFKEAFSEAAKSNYSRAMQQETDQLIAAGFSMDRIQYLRGRSAQLDTDRRNAEADRRMKGLPPVVDLAYSLDNSDLDLEKEIGELEYQKYRKASGRQVSVPVASVLPGSVAQIVGLKPGDEIVKVDGQHVYNFGQLTKLSEKDAGPGGRLILVVQRNGLPLQFDVPSGVLGITSPLHPGSVSKMFEYALKSQGTQP